MTIYRDMHPSELDDVIDLIDLSFGGMRPNEALSKTYGPEPNQPARHVVAEDETTGRLLAVAAMYPQTLSVAGHTLHAWFLGVVGVHPRHRGEGHMQGVVNLLQQEARDAGDVDLLVLWGLRHRYAYFGYTPFGYDYSYGMNGSDVKHALASVDADDVAFRPLFDEPGDVEIAQRLNDARTVHVERDGAYLDRTLAHLRSDALAAVRGGEVLGYLTRDRRNPSQVHEVALFDPRDAGAVMKAYWTSLQPCGLDSFDLRISPTDVGLNEQLSIFSEGASVENLTQCDILDYAAVIEAYLAAANESWGVEPGRFSAVLDGQPVTVTVADGAVHAERVADDDAPRLDKADAQTLLGGLCARYRRDLPHTPAGWFPLPVSWYWSDLN